MMNSLPENWKSDYDGERWFYVYLPTGNVQYHFPQPGDEYAEFLHTSSVVPDLTPEERLESERQVKRRGTTSGTGERGSRAAASRRSTRDTPVTETQDDVDDGGGYLFSFESFGYLGPGSYNDVSPLNEEEDGRPDDVPRDLGRKAEGSSARRAALETPRENSLSPLASTVTTPNVANSFVMAAEPVMAPTTAPTTGEPVRSPPRANEPAAAPVVGAPVLAVDTAAAHNIIAVDSGMVQSPDIPMLHSESRPFELPDAAHMGASNSHALAQNHRVFSPVGFVAELASDATAQCAEEANPPPIELPGNEIMFGGWQTNLIPSAPVELPHNPIEVLPTPPAETAQAEKPLPSQGLARVSSPPQDPGGRPALQAETETPPAADTRAYLPFRAKNITRDETLAKRSSVVLGDVSLAESQNREMGHVDKRHSLAGPALPAKRDLSDTPAALQPPRVPPKRPLDDDDKVLRPASVAAPSHPVIPGTEARHQSIPSPSDGGFGGIPAALRPAPGQGPAPRPNPAGLSHFPSILKPARGQSPARPMQPSGSSEGRRVHIAAKPYMSYQGHSSRGGSPARSAAAFGPNAGQNHISSADVPQPGDPDFRPGLQRVNTLPDQLPSHAVMHDPTGSAQPTQRRQHAGGGQPRPQSLYASSEVSIDTPETLQAAVVRPGRASLVEIPATSPPRRTSAGTPADLGGTAPTRIDSSLVSSGASMVVKDPPPGPAYPYLPSGGVSGRFPHSGPPFPANNDTRTGDSVVRTVTPLTGNAMPNSSLPNQEFPTPDDRPAGLPAISRMMTPIDGSLVAQKPDPVPYRGPAYGSSFGVMGSEHIVPAVPPSVPPPAAAPRTTFDGPSADGSTRRGVAETSTLPLGLTPKPEPHGIMAQPSISTFSVVMGGIIPPRSETPGRQAQQSAPGLLVDGQVEVQPLRLPQSQASVAGPAGPPPHNAIRDNAQFLSKLDLSDRDRTREPTRLISQASTASESQPSPTRQPPAAPNRMAAAAVAPTSSFSPASQNATSPPTGGALQRDARGDIKERAHPELGPEYPVGYRLPSLEPPARAAPVPQPNAASAARQTQDTASIPDEIISKGGASSPAESPRSAKRESMSHQPWGVALPSHPMAPAGRRRGSTPLQESPHKEQQFPDRAGPSSQGSPAPGLGQSTSSLTSVSESPPEVTAPLRGSSQPRAPPIYGPRGSVPPRAEATPPQGQTGDQQTIMGPIVPAAPFPQMQPLTRPPAGVSGGPAVPVRGPPQAPPIQPPPPPDQMQGTVPQVLHAQVPRQSQTTAPLAPGPTVARPWKPSPSGQSANPQALAPGPTAAARQPNQGPPGQVSNLQAQPFSTTTQQENRRFSLVNPVGSVAPPPVHGQARPPAGQPLPLHSKKSAAPEAPTTRPPIPPPPHMRPRKESPPAQGKAPSPPDPPPGGLPTMTNAQAMPAPPPLRTRAPGPLPGGAAPGGPRPVSLHQVYPLQAGQPGVYPQFVPHPGQAFLPQQTPAQPPQQHQPQYGQVRVSMAPPGQLPAQPGMMPPGHHGIPQQMAPLTTGGPSPGQPMQYGAVPVGYSWTPPVLPPQLQPNVTQPPLAGFHPGGQPQMRTGPFVPGAPAQAAGVYGGVPLVYNQQQAPPMATASGTQPPLSSQPGTASSPVQSMKRASVASVQSQAPSTPASQRQARNSVHSIPSPHPGRQSISMPPPGVDALGQTPQTAAGQVTRPGEGLPASTSSPSHMPPPAVGLTQPPVAGGPIQQVSRIPHGSMQAPPGVSVQPQPPGGPHFGGPQFGGPGPMQQPGFPGQAGYPQGMAPQSILQGMPPGMLQGPPQGQQPLGLMPQGMTPGMAPPGTGPFPGPGPQLQGMRPIQPLPSQVPQPDPGVSQPSLPSQPKTKGLFGFLRGASVKRSQGASSPVPGSNGRATPPQSKLQKSPSQHKVMPLYQTPQPPMQGLYEPGVQAAQGFPGQLPLGRDPPTMQQQPPPSQTPMHGPPGSNSPLSQGQGPTWPQGEHTMGRSPSQHVSVGRAAGAAAGVTAGAAVMQAIPEDGPGQAAMVPAPLFSGGGNRASMLGGPVSPTETGPATQGVDAVRVDDPPSTAVSAGRWGGTVNYSGDDWGDEDY